MYQQGKHHKRVTVDITFCHYEERCLMSIVNKSSLFSSAKYTRFSLFLE